MDENHQVARDFAVRSLTQAGPAALQAAHGADALRIHDSHVWVVVLSAVDMPVMEGLELLATRNKCYPPLSTLPVIAGAKGSQDQEINQAGRRLYKALSEVLSQAFVVAALAANAGAKA